MKKLRLKILDENVLKNNGLVIYLTEENNYFGKKDGQAYANLTIFEDGRLALKYIVTREKYKPRVLKELTANNIKYDYIVSREEFNKNLKQKYSAKLEVYEE